MWDQLRISKGASYSRITYPSGVNLKKVIVRDFNKVKIIYTKDGNRIVNLLDLKNIRTDEMVYTNTATSPKLFLSTAPSYLGLEFIVKDSVPFHIPVITPTDTFPIYWLADGETEGDEPVTLNTPLFTEPDWLWGDIMSRRLSVLARRFVNGTDKAWLDIKTKSRNYASDLISDETTLKQYNNCMNAFKSCIGHTWKLVKDIESTTLAPDDKPDRDDVEALIGKLEEALPHNEIVEDFFHQNDADAWWDAHALRRIHIPRIAQGEKGVGELLHDINKDHTHDTDGLNPTNAEKDWDACVRGCFNMAWESLKRVPRTEIAYSYGWDADSAVTFPKEQPEPSAEQE